MKQIETYILEKLKIDKDIQVNKISENTFAYARTQDAIHSILSSLRTSTNIEKSLAYIDEEANDYGFILNKELVNKFKYNKNIDFYQIPENIDIKDFKEKLKSGRIKYYELIHIKHIKI